MIRANGEEVGRRGAEEIKCKQSNGCSVGTATSFTIYRVFFSLVPLKVLSTNKLIFARLGVSRPIGGNSNKLYNQTLFFYIYFKTFDVSKLFSKQIIMSPAG